MPGVAAKALLFAAMLAAPGAGAPTAPAPAEPQPADARLPPARTLGDRALAEDSRGFPAGPHGEARFYLQGTYFSEMGFTKGGHLAIWEWDGHRARPLLARHFTFMIAQEAPVLTVRGGDLLLHVKGELSHFFSCGQCEGRPLVWHMRMA